MRSEVNLESLSRLQRLLSPPRSNPLMTSIRFLCLFTSSTLSAVYKQHICTSCPQILGNFLNPSPSLCGYHFLVAIQSNSGHEIRSQNSRTLKHQTSETESVQMADLQRIHLPFQATAGFSTIIINVNLSYLPTQQHGRKFCCIHPVFEPTSVLHKGRTH